MDNKNNSHEGEYLSLPPLRFILTGNPTFDQKDIKLLTPVRKPGLDMEINVRKLIAHLHGSK